MTKKGTDIIQKSTRTVFVINRDNRTKSKDRKGEPRKIIEIEKTTLGDTLVRITSVNGYFGNYINNIDGYKG